MNPKAEFIKAITQVLRLDANIYTMGAIEEIIERVDMEDYAMFIAFLGERESDYEKPIQSIAKGVEEFYKMKIKPLQVAAMDKADSICEFVGGYLHLTSKDKLRSEVVSDTENDPTKILSTRLKNTGDGNILSMSKETFDLVMSIGGLEEVFTGKGRSELIEKLMDGKVKPSIIEKIKNGAVRNASENFKIEDKRVMALLQKGNLYPRSG